MGKSIKSECVIQILSRAQKHEQVLKFPTHILSAWSCSVSAHKRPHAACGLRGGNYLFIGCWTGLVADWAGLSVCQDGLGRDQDCLDALDALFGPAQSALPWRYPTCLAVTPLSNCRSWPRVTPPRDDHLMYMRICISLLWINAVSNLILSPLSAYF